MSKTKCMHLQKQRQIKNSLSVRALLAYKSGAFVCKQSTHSSSSCTPRTFTKRGLLRFAYKNPGFVVPRLPRSSGDPYLAKVESTKYLQTQVYSVSPRSGKTTHRRDLLIRQFSKNSKTLHFAKDVITFNGVHFFRQGNRKLNTLYMHCMHNEVVQQNESLFLRARVPRSSTKQGFVRGVRPYSVGVGGIKRFKSKSSILSFDLQSDQLLFANNHFYRLDLYRKLGYLYGTNLNKMSFLSSDLSNLGLSLKSYTLLKKKGIHKVGNLVKYSPKALLQLLNRNRDMFAEVKRCLLLIAICRKT